MIQTFKSFYSKYERWVPIVAFACGFLFDMMVLHRIDEPQVLIQQAIYLLVSCVLVTVDLIEKVREIPAPFLFARVWKYREFLMHFLIGTLLNSYTIFYFKSASGVTSFVFIILLVAALTLAEFKNFGEAQRKVHVSLWCLCLVSYFQSLVPILLGTVGSFPFLISSLASILVFTLYVRVLQSKLESHPELIRSHVLLPYGATHGLFAMLYFLHAIPPVPLSVSYMGIYHEVEKKEGHYYLSYSRPSYKFWQHGDETFEARTGDRVVAFVQVFLPEGFKEQLQVKWSLYDEVKGWVLQDTVPLTLIGGREEGFRATVVKNNYQNGLWRIQIETSEDREVGRLKFTITPEADTSERQMRVDVR